MSLLCSYLDIAIRYRNSSEFWSSAVVNIFSYWSSRVFFTVTAESLVVLELRYRLLFCFFQQLWYVRTAVTKCSFCWMAANLHYVRELGKDWWFFSPVDGCRAGLSLNLWLVACCCVTYFSAEGLGNRVWKHQYKYCRGNSLRRHVYAARRALLTWLVSYFVKEVHIKLCAVSPTDSRRCVMAVIH
jgi:hypothetical protein